ncbi:MAG: hypothetical protein HY074_18965 [Deltaproteobacteria bacterium]|nr:hypothetical protein [Deltaproteobacteria bacterium]
MKNQNKKVVSAAIIGLMVFILNAGMTSKARAAETETTIPAQTETAFENPTPNGGTFTLRVVNKTSQPLVLLVDTNCARGPDYRQGVDRGQTRDLSYDTYSGGSCFFERSEVRIGIKDLTPARMHWQSGMVPAGWNRGELDGKFPDNMDFRSSANGDATLTVNP